MSFYPDPGGFALAGRGVSRLSCTHSEFGFPKPSGPPQPWVGGWAWEGKERAGRCHPEGALTMQTQPRNAKHTKVKRKVGLQTSEQKVLEVGLKERIQEALPALSFG